MSLKEIYFEVIYVVSLISKDLAAPSMVTSVPGIFPAKSNIIGKDIPPLGTS